MSRSELVDAVIDDGIEEIRHLYTRPDQRIKKDGGIEGFTACRGKTDSELLTLLQTARTNTRLAMDKADPLYWGKVMFERQVEWVLNVLSAAMYSQNLTPLIPPTVRGFNKAADVLGIKQTLVFKSFG